MTSPKINPTRVQIASYVPPALVRRIDKMPGGKRSEKILRLIELGLRVNELQDRAVGEAFDKEAS